MKIKQMWMRKIAAIGDDADGISVLGVSVLGVDLAGNAIIAVESKFEDGSGYKSWLTKNSPDGRELWRRNFDKDKALNSLRGVVDAAGNIFVTGLTMKKMGSDDYVETFDVFVARVSHDGTLDWLNQVGSVEHETSNYITVDSQGSVYLASCTYGNVAAENSGGAGSGDVFIVKYSPGGEELRRIQLALKGDQRSRAMTVDASDNIYVLGWTTTDIETGAYTGGSWDMSVVKFTPELEVVWRHQKGTPQSDLGHDIAVDPHGNFCVSGWTHGDFAGAQQGEGDVFLAKYAPDCTELWKKQFGTEAPDSSYNIKLDPLGNVIYTGRDIGQDTELRKGLWLRIFNPHGEEVLYTQMDSLGDIHPSYFEPDGVGNIYIAGPVQGKPQPGAEPGLGGICLAKVALVPETFEELNDLNYLRFLAVQKLDAWQNK